MNLTIRKMHPNEYPLLGDFLYQAIYQPDTTNLAPKSIINKPELQVYIKDFGRQRMIIAFVPGLIIELSEQCGCVISMDTAVLTMLQLSLLSRFLTNIKNGDSHCIDE